MTFILSLNTKTEGRQRVSKTQLDTLCEFLNEHRDIATGYNKSTNARHFSKRMWQTIAQTLNAMVKVEGDGALKDWRGWNKYWNDYKFKLKKFVATISASQGCTGGKPSDVPQLTDVEFKFLQILGESYGSGLSVDRVESLEQVQVTESEVETIPQNIEGVYILQQNNGSAPTTLLTPVRLNTPIVQLQPSKPCQQKLTPPVEASRGSLSQTSMVNERSPQRRIRRREPPLSQSMRRSLVAEQKNQKLLRELVEEIRAVKDILKTRSPLPDTPEQDLQENTEDSVGGTSFQDKSYNGVTNSQCNTEETVNNTPIEAEQPRTLKKRRLQESASLLTQVKEVCATNNALPSEEHEFDIFGRGVAAQLKMLPLKQALQAQHYIQSYLTGLRLQDSSGSEASSPCSVKSE